VELWGGAQRGTGTEEARVHDLLVTLLTLVPLDATPIATAVQEPVSPGGRGNGFAASILGGFFGLGLIVLAAVFISLKPKRHDPRDNPPPRQRPR
jgi:hypothetical protein